MTESTPGTCLRPGCGRPQYNRGLCAGCYQVVRAMIRNGETTWAKLVSNGKCRAIQKPRGRGEIRKWFASASQEFVSSCPFCRTENAKPAETGQQCIQVHCTNCGAFGPTAGNAADATNYWNNQ